MPRHDLPTEDRFALLARAAAALAAMSQVRVAWAFGSFVRAEPFRDLDVAVVLDEPWSLLSLGRVARMVAEALGWPPWEVDVVPLNDATPAFRWAVVREGRVLYERTPGDATEDWVLARNLWLDFSAWRALRLEEA